MFEDIFKRKKVIFKELEAYGFKKIGNTYQYSTDILNAEFNLEITIGESSVMDTKLTDRSTGEEYILYKTNADGKFVEGVREEVISILKSISDLCYESAVFKTEQSIKLISYVREKYGDELEYLWKKFPDNAVWRRKDNDKWYGALLTVSKRKLGVQSDEIVEILDLRCEPEILESIIDNETIFPGWHMNKKHWYTIILDGSVPLEQICRRIDESYILAK